MRANTAAICVVVAVPGCKYPDSNPPSVAVGDERECQCGECYH